MSSPKPKTPLKSVPKPGAKPNAPAASGGAKPPAAKPPAAKLPAAKPPDAKLPAAKSPDAKLPDAKLPTETPAAASAKKAAFPRPASRALPPKPSGRRQPLPRPGVKATKGKAQDKTKPAPSADAARAKSNLRLPGRPAKPPPEAEDSLDEPIALSRPKSIDPGGNDRVQARHIDSLDELQEIDEPFDSAPERISLSEVEVLEETAVVRPSSEGLEILDGADLDLESLPPGSGEANIDDIARAAALKAPPVPEEAERVSFSELVEVEAPPPPTKRKKRRSSKAPKAKRNSKAPKAERNSKAPKAKRNSKAPKTKRNSKAPKAKRDSKAPKAERNSKAPKAKRNSKAPKAAAATESDRLSIPPLGPLDPSLSLGAPPTEEPESNKKGYALMALVAVVSLVLGGVTMKLIDGSDDAGEDPGPAIASAPTQSEPLDEPVAAEPATEEPATEEPDTEEPDTEELAAEEPVAEEPVTAPASRPARAARPRVAAARPRPAARPTTRPTPSAAPAASRPAAPAAQAPDDAPAIAATTNRANRPPPQRRRDAPPPRDAAARPSRAQVEAAIQSVAPAIRQCAPDLGGHRAAIRFRFVSSGRATMAVVETNAASGPQRSCMARAARSARVAPFTDPQLLVTYPLTL